MKHHSAADSCTLPLLPPLLLRVVHQARHRCHLRSSYAADQLVSTKVRVMDSEMVHWWDQPIVQKQDRSDLEG